MWRRIMMIILWTGGLSLLLLESLFRVFSLSPTYFEVYHPTRGWVYQPYASGMHFNPLCVSEVRNFVRMNNHGRYDFDRSYEKPPNITRILLLGDSTVASFEVPLEDALHRQLEQRLSRLDSARQYEVLNGGYRTYGTSLEWLFYEQEAHLYQSDAVLLVFQTFNDLDDNQAKLRPQRMDYYPYFEIDAEGALVLRAARRQPQTIHITLQPLNPLHDFLFHHLYTYRLFSERRWLLQLADEPVFVDPTVYDEAWLITEALIHRLRDRVAADGARFGVVISYSIERFMPLHQRLRAFLEASGIPFFDLQTAFAAYPENRLIFPCDRHFTPEGHRVAAEAIAPFVVGLLGTP